MVKRTPRLRRLVLDVLKPHNPPLPEFATKLGNLPGVKGVTVTSIEMDKETETLKIVIEGNLDYSRIRSNIEEWGGVIHSVDEVAVGKPSQLEVKRRFSIRGEG